MKLILGSLVALVAYAANADVTHASLRKLIETNNIRSIESLLPLLPEKFRSHYTLMHTSRSLQEASFENPRAIVFGRNGKFIMTFNGDAQQRGFDSLEMMEFNDSTKKFEFHSIGFGETVTFSEKNPKKCLMCHGQNPQPVWGGYFRWPGAYGSMDDYLFSNESPQEGPAYNQFLNLQASHPRYKHLVRLESSPLYPFRPQEGFDLRHINRPNNRLGNLLTRMKAQQILTEIQDSPLLKTHRDFFLSWFLDCALSRDQAFADKAKQLFETTYPFEKYPDVYKFVKKIKTDFQTAFYLEKLLSGPYAEAWSLDPQYYNDGRRYTTGFLLQEDLVGARLFEKLARTDFDLKPYYAPASMRENPRVGSDYFDKNIAPGGIGAAYDSLGLFYDTNLSNAWCTRNPI